jgi:hypothetical protein
VDGVWLSFCFIRWTQKRYRDFVREGLASRSCEELRGQIYLGSEEFVEEDSPKNLQLKEIPRAQLHAVKPSLERIFARQGERGIVRAYKNTAIGSVRLRRTWEFIMRRWAGD